MRRSRERRGLRTQAQRVRRALYGLVSLTLFIAFYLMYRIDTATDTDSPKPKSSKSLPNLIQLIPGFSYISSFTIRVRESLPSLPKSSYLSHGSRPSRRHSSLSPGSLSNPQKVHVPAGVLPSFSGDYMIRMFFISPEYFANWKFEDVTLVTMCSANHLHHIISLAERWSGPISVGVFGPGLEASFATDAIESIKNCFPAVREQVLFHLVYPISLPADLSKSSGKLRFENCDDLRKQIKSYGGDEDDRANYGGAIPFPHNVLRNAARRGAPTAYIFLIDVDVMPSLNLREDFNDFAIRHGLYDKNENAMTVFVVPVFEKKKGSTCPDNKRELAESCDKNEVRSFHEETCKWCHEPEQPKKWLQIQGQSRLEISFNSSWTKSWEPFYIASRQVPYFDERFMVYGFDRIQQICELHVAGYEFAVLNTAFLVHDGWKFPDKEIKELQNRRRSRNWVLFHFHYQQVLLKMYQNPKSCAPIETFVPKGFKALAHINSRNNRIKRKYA